ncbi:hypothetical protein N7495_007501 [Penicillium taxi]|uniref:uncharacterized protein n=1 Tax=Penicillium taxi TaxID=168475 RepID=UPI00254594CC|nr:uncharacterized protein N7495_007501 [Penicillium taxi]KAJ5887460.1 hypothetical protein N7495_007501 [Penicillium taxi]
MVESRNLIAKFRRSELQLLGELAVELCSPMSTPVFPYESPPQMSLAGSFPPSVSGLSAAQIMAVADSIESIDTDVECDD